MNAQQQILDALHTRITRVFPEQVRAAIAPLDDEQLWWRPNESSNSIGNLMLHLAGSIDHYLNRNLGGLVFDRNRPAEFAERTHIPKDEVLARFDEMVANAERTFAQLTADKLAAPSPEPKMYAIVAEDIINVATHLATHVGQIIWIAKMLRDTSLDDLWMRAHKNGGAWK